MSKNLIPQIAAMLGLQLGEEFKVKGAADWMLFHFEEHGLRVRNVDKKVELSDGVDSALFERLLGGYLEIIKLPWKPKENDVFYTFLLDFKLDFKGDVDGYVWKVAKCFWDDSPVNFALFKAGWVYRTLEEAKAALPDVAKELGVEYEL